MSGLVPKPASAFESLGWSLKNFLWNAATRVALHGLCTWEFQTDWVLVERHEMPLPTLGDFEGATLVHLSDLHSSPLIREAHLRRYVELANRLEPDFVVLTGDFITATSRSYARTIRNVLRDLSPRMATLAVLGNHDYGVWHPRMHSPVSGLSGYVAEQLDAAGVEVLINRPVIYKRGASSIRFVGVGDLWTPSYRPTVAFRGRRRGEPIISLVHNPDAAFDLAALGAHYVLAGHTHGKPTPDSVLNNLLFPVNHRQFIAGEYVLPGDRRLYVNRGVGHSRRSHMHHRPEITLFELRDATLRRSDAARKEAELVS